AEAVAFVHAMRQVRMNGPSQRSQHLKQNRRRGNAIDIIVAENYKRLFVRMRLEQSLHSYPHIWKEKRIGQMPEPWVEIIADGGRFAEATVQEALREQWRNPEIL